jgi:hypothetical protein
MLENALLLHAMCQVGGLAKFFQEQGQGMKQNTFKVGLSS